MLTQEEIAIMTAKIAMKINYYQTEINKLQKVSARMGIISAVDPKDQFGDVIDKIQIDKHSVKAKAEFEKIFPPTK